MKTMHADVKEVLISKEKIAEIVNELGKKITADYEGKNPLLLCVLKGAAPFATDLFRNVDTEAEMDFVQISSYGTGTTSGALKIKRDADASIEGRHVIVVDDILDTGNTLNYFCGYLRSQNPASVKLCVMLDKKERRQADIEADYVGAVVPDEFIVGYGLDYAEKYRNLPYIGVLKREIYE